MCERIRSIVFIDNRPFTVAAYVAAVRHLYIISTIDAIDGYKFKTLVIIIAVKRMQNKRIVLGSQIHTCRILDVIGFAGFGRRYRRGRCSKTGQNSKSKKNFFHGQSKFIDRKRHPAR